MVRQKIKIYFLKETKHSKKEFRKTEMKIYNTSELFGQNFN